MKKIFRNLTLEVRIIILLSFLILLLHFLFHPIRVLGLEYSIFYLDEEFSVGSIFTTSIALIAFLYCLKAASSEVTKKLKYLYLATSSLFLYYSIEESFSTRDVINNYIKETPGLLAELANFSWILSLGVFVLLFFVLLSLLIFLETKIKVKLSLGLGILAFLVVVVLEFIGGRLYGTQYEYLIAVGLEEFMEMIGLAFFVNAFALKFTESKS